jgi:membrane-associated phospholipid phosphatase
MADRWASRLARGILGTGRANACISVALAALVFLGGRVYSFQNHGPAHVDLQTPLDAAIPLVKTFVLPYVVFDVYIFASLFVFMMLKTRTFQSAAFAFILAQGLSNLFFAFMQTEVARPALVGSDVLTRILRDVYASDPPFNAFPSLHVSLSTNLAIHWRRLDRRSGGWAWALSAVIIVSTVFVKQHYLADVAGGLILGWACSSLPEALLPRGIGADECPERSLFDLRGSAACSPVQREAKD